LKRQRLGDDVIGSAHARKVEALGGLRGLPKAYAPEFYKEKYSAVFEHVYDSYPERDPGVYAESA
jgi:hypothetical protein